MYEDQGEDSTRRRVAGDPHPNAGREYTVQFQTTVTVPAGSSEVTVMASLCGAPTDEGGMLPMDAPLFVEAISVEESVSTGEVAFWVQNAYKMRPKTSYGSDATFELPRGTSTRVRAAHADKANTVEEKLQVYRKAGRPSDDDEEMMGSPIDAEQFASYVNHEHGHALASVMRGPHRRIAKGSSLWQLAAANYDRAPSASFDIEQAEMACDAMKVHPYLPVNAASFARLMEGFRGVEKMLERKPVKGAILLKAKRNGGDDDDDSEPLVVTIAGSATVRIATACHMVM